MLNRLALASPTAAPTATIALPRRHCQSHCHVGTCLFNTPHSAAGLFAYSNITGLVHTRATPGLGMSAESAVLHASATVVNDGASPADICTTFTLLDGAGKSVGSAAAPKTSLGAGQTATVRSSIDVAAPELWSSQKLGC